MKLNFSIEYKTNWGETIVLCLDGKRHPLEYVADGIWQGEVTRPSLKEALEYKYEVVCDGVTVRKEWGQHVLPKGLSAKVVTVNDRWQDRPADAPFYSSAFTKAIFGRGKEKSVVMILLQEPGGSIRDDLVIEECDKHGIVMAFTGMRLFHH